MDPMANQVYVDFKLSTLIKTNSICTWGEVVSSLRNYITTKSLFDSRKMKVVCQNDELESLFGISEFSILDIGHLLKKLVCPIPQHTQASMIKTTGRSPSTPTFCMKRKSEDCIEEEIQVKKKSNSNSNSIETSTSDIYKENASLEVSSPMILQIPSSPKDELDCESISADSVETSFCKDSTDDTSDAHHSAVTHTFVTLETYDVEFEPLSSSDDQSDESRENSESELDLSLISELSSIVTFVANLESDLEEYLADLSSEDSSSDDSSHSAFDFDAEIGLLDNWQCSACLRKNSPINRYCSKCFFTRNGWCNVEKKYGLGEKKKRKKRKPRSKRKKKKSNEEEDSDVRNNGLSKEIDYKIDDVPPWYVCFILSFQHYLTMLGGTVSYPYLIAPHLCIPDDDPSRGYLISSTFFVSGICTFLQTTFGARLPIVQGSSMAFMVPILAVLHLPQWECPKVSPNTTLSIEAAAEIWMPRMREVYILLSSKIAESAV